MGLSLRSWRAFWWNWRHNKGGVVIYDRDLAADKTFTARIAAALKEAEARLWV